MKHAHKTRGSLSLLLAVVLTILVMAAVPVRGAEETQVMNPATAAVVEPGWSATSGPTAVAAETKPIVWVSSIEVSTAPAPEPAASENAAAILNAPEPAITSPAAIAPVTVQPQAPTAAAIPPAAAATPAAGAAPEAFPERTETVPVLVGPDDDRLLKEVEKHVVIVPAEPAIKIADPTYDIPMDLNAKVLDYVEIFQTTRRRSFEAGLIRSHKYETLMKPIFSQLGIPTDLYYLALIESGYNPKAYSYAKAMGIWQFISSTGKIYGLRRTDWLDERRDPEKATRAAARHLKDLFTDLGSWPLAFAAYNAGKGRVQRAIAKAGSTDFWSLDLPAQTRNYVPAFFAAVIIAKDPERYGFQLEYERLDPTEVIEVGGGTRLSLVAALCSTSVETIQDLNPELRKPVVPPGARYPLRIPEGRTGELAAGLAKVPASRTATPLSTYRVAPGDTLFSIAQRFGTTPEAIRDGSRMKDNDIRPGQQLVIPGLRLAEAPIPRAPGRIVISSTLPLSYRVRPGDNPWSIARRFNIPLDNLLAWNNIDTETTLNIDQTIALREPATLGVATARAARGGKTYEVRRGDNLWQISRKFDASVEELRRLNGFGSDHDLQPGERVILP